MQSPYLSYKSQLRFINNKLSPNQNHIPKYQKLDFQTNSDPKLYALSKTFSHRFPTKSSKFNVRFSTQNISQELVQKIKSKAKEEQQKLRNTIQEERKVKMYPSFVSRMLSTHKHHIELQYCRSKLKNANQIQVRKLSMQNSRVKFYQNSCSQIQMESSDNQGSTSNINRMLEEFDRTFIVLGRNSRHQTNKEQTKRMNLTMDLSLTKEHPKRNLSRPLRKIKTLGKQRTNKEQEFEAWNFKSVVQEQTIAMFLQSEKASLNLRPSKRKKMLSRSYVN